MCGSASPSRRGSFSLSSFHPYHILDLSSPNCTTSIISNPSHKQPKPFDLFPKDLSHHSITPFFYRPPRSPATNSKSLQTHHGQTRASVAASADLALVQPPPFRMFDCLLSGVSYLLGNMLLPPHACSAPMTSALRPPPELPPHFKGKDCVGSSSLSASLQLKFVTSSVSPGSEFSLRLPRKPPWLRLVLFGSCCSGALKVFRFSPVCFNIFWFQNTYLVFAESPHRTPGCLNTGLWPWLRYLETVRTFGAGTFSECLSYYHLASLSQAKRMNLETILSRMEHTLVKDIICN